MPRAKAQLNRVKLGSTGFNNDALYLGLTLDPWLILAWHWMKVLLQTKKLIKIVGNDYSRLLMHFYVKFFGKYGANMKYPSKQLTNWLLGRRKMLKFKS